MHHHGLIALVGLATLATVTASEDPYRATWLVRGGVSLPDADTREKSGAPSWQFGATRLFREYRGVMAAPSAEADVRYANGDGGTLTSIGVGYAERWVVAPRIHAGVAPQLWGHHVRLRTDDSTVTVIRPGVRAIAATTVSVRSLRLVPMGIELFAQTLGSVDGDTTVDLGIQLVLGF